MESFEFNEIPSIVSATAQKSEAGMWTLAVEIQADGEVVSSSSTSAEFGLASTSHSF
jgi:hypothetical protein